MFVTMFDNQKKKKEGCVCDWFWVLICDFFVLCVVLIVLVLFCFVFLPLFFYFTLFFNYNLLYYQLLLSINPIVCMLFCFVLFWFWLILLTLFWFDLMLSDWSLFILFSFELFPLPPICFGLIFLFLCVFFFDCQGKELLNDNIWHVVLYFMLSFCLRCCDILRSWIFGV